jgi:hypothetical protein
LQFAFEPSLPWQHSKVPKCVDCQLPQSLSPLFPMVIANENEEKVVPRHEPDFSAQKGFAGPGGLAFPTATNF